MNPRVDRWLAATHAALALLFAALAYANRRGA